MKGKTPAIGMTVLALLALALGFSLTTAAQTAGQPGGQPAAAPGGTAQIEVTSSNTIKLNFPEMDLESVLKNFSALTGKNFILDQMPKGQILTIGPIGPVEVPKDQVYNLFVLIMGINGYTIVPTSVTNVYKVVRSADTMHENIPIYPPGRAPAISEQMVTRFITMKYVNASDISSQLGQLSSKEGGQVMAYAPTNTLIILDTALNINRMLKIIHLLDVPSPEPDIEIVTLKHSVASEMAGILSQVFQGESAPQTTTRTATTRERPRRGGRPIPQPQPQPAQTTGTNPEAGLPKIIAVDRINALVIIAVPDMMDSIKDFITKLDIDTGTTGTIHVYYVQNAEASELAATLSGLAGGGGGGGAVSRPTTSRTTQNRGMSRFGTTSGFGQSYGGYGSSMGYGGYGGYGGGMGLGLPATPPQTSTSTGPTTAKMTGIMGGEVTISTDEATNSLIIVCSPQDYEILKAVIEKLDIPRRQVFVEAVLLEITYNESEQAGASMHAASGLDNNGLVFSGTSFSAVNSIGLLSSLSGTSGSLTLPSGITIGALGQPVTVPGTGGQVVIPSAGLVLSLLSSESNVNVLSTPTLLTTDNVQASIQVGQEIPVPTGQTVSTGGFSNVSISREPVGIMLSLTPQINESDNIRLDIATQISGAIQSSLGIDVNTLGVTTSIKSVETSVIVRDSQTIVIGGLMQDTENGSQSKVPFIGDIPVLGWLFKNATKSRNKTNLVILLTPHIVKSDADIERVKQHIKEGYDSMTEESLGEGAPDWDHYFQSQLNPQSGGTVIDLRGKTPVVNNPVEWEWTPPSSTQTGDTVEPPRSATTPSPNGEPAGPQQGSTAEGGPQ